MPRFKGDESDRQRVAKACAQCRKRKEKCDRELPCAHCKKRGYKCLYSPNGDSSKAPTASSGNERISVEYSSDAEFNSGEQQRPASPGTSVASRSKRRFAARSNTANSPFTRSTKGASSSRDDDEGISCGDRSRFNRRGSRGGRMLQLAESTNKLKQPEDETGSVLSEYGDGAAMLDTRRCTTRRRHTISTTSRDQTAMAVCLAVSEAQVPRMPRRFRDGCGRSIYMGDSSTPSFIHNVRQLVFDLGGTSDFTTDPLRHTFLDLPTPSPVPCFPLFDVDPTWKQAEVLANQYLTATTCLLDFLDPETLFRSIRVWLGGGSSGGEDVLPQPVLYLVMAIGAQVTAEDIWTQIGEHYFAIGRQHALNYDVSDGSLEAVQLHILLAMFSLGASRRHAAFMYLGTAVRAAQTLGLQQLSHYDAPPGARHDPLACTWQSLRTLNLFLSITLGRPTATSDSEENMPEYSSGKQKTSISESAMFAISIRRLSGIFEMILRDVYAQSVVSIAAVDNISTHLRLWSENLPPLPPTKPLTNEPTTSMYSDKARAVMSAHLIGAYHWSIILLTRPLLLSYVLRVAGSLLSNDEAREPGGEGSSSATTTEASHIARIRNYAIGSIHSAMHIVEITNDLMKYADLPKRLPFVTNSVFNAALVIGVAHFGNFDRLFPLASLMDTVVWILNHMSVHDEVARRYAQVADYLRSAASKFVYDRNNCHLQSSRQTTNNIFGAIGLSLVKEPAQNLPGPISMPYGHSNGCEQTSSVYSDASGSMESAFMIGSTCNIVSDAMSSNPVVPAPICGTQQDGHLLFTEGKQFLTTPEVFHRPEFMLANVPLSSMSPQTEQQFLGILQQAEQNDFISGFDIGNANRT